MYSTINDEVFDGLLRSAFSDYAEREFDALPSQDELARMFPVSQKSLKKARRRAKELKYRKPTALIYLHRAAIVVLVCAALSFGVLMTSEKVRAAMSNAVVEWFDKYMAIDFSKSESADGSTNVSSDVSADGSDQAALSDSTDVSSAEGSENNTEATSVYSFEIGYIPDGFEITKSVEYDEKRIYLYETAEGLTMAISISLTKNVSVAVDHEFSEIEETTVNGKSAYISYNHTERMGTIVFGDPEYTIAVTIMAEKNELIKIAENIKMK